MSEPPQGNTVDPEEIDPQGSGSGLDADTVDGSESSSLGGSPVDMDWTGKPLITTKAKYASGVTPTGSPPTITGYSAGRYGGAKAYGRQREFTTNTTYYYSWTLSGLTGTGVAAGGFMGFYINGSGTGDINVDFYLNVNGSQKGSQTATYDGGRYGYLATPFTNITSYTFSDDTLTFSAKVKATGGTVTGTAIPHLYPWAEGYTYTYNPSQSWSPAWANVGIGKQGYSPQEPIYRFTKPGNSVNGESLNFNGGLASSITTGDTITFNIGGFPSGKSFSFYLYGGSYV